MDTQFDRIMNYILEDPILDRQIEDYDQDTLTAIAQDNATQDRQEELIEENLHDWEHIQYD